MPGRPYSQKSREFRKKGEEGEKNKSKYGDIFMGFRKELDAKQDAKERLVKLSRDCTIQSKRVIFTLHQFTGGEGSKEKVLREAESKFHEDIFPHLRSIALELIGRDPNQFLYAYYHGLQEFIEAISFYTYLKYGRLISFEEVQKCITFQPKKKTDEENEKHDKCKDIPEAQEPAVSLECLLSSREGIYSDLQKSELIVLPLSYSDYLLGLADLTGELMRLSINAVGSGHVELPFILLPFFRAISCGFLGINPEVKYLSQKLQVLQASLRKVENVCYTLKIRGSEIPRHALMNVLADNEPEQ